jgi:hypothetical protein
MRGRLRKATADQGSELKASTTPLRPVPANGVSTKNILIVGAAEKAKAFEKVCRTRFRSEVGFTGILDLNPIQADSNGHHPNGERVLGGLDDLSRVIESHSIDGCCFWRPFVCRRALNGPSPTVEKSASRPESPSPPRPIRS